MLSGTSLKSYTLTDPEMSPLLFIFDDFRKKISVLHFYGFSIGIWGGGGGIQSKLVTSKIRMYYLCWEHYMPAYLKRYSRQSPWCYMNVTDCISRNRHGRIACVLGTSLTSFSGSGQLSHLCTPFGQADI